MEENGENTRTKLPINSHREDLIMDWEFVKLSPRQALLLMFSLAIWALMASLTTSVLPVGFIFGGILWSWIIIGSFYLAFRRKDGRPYEEYLTDKILFMIRDRRYVLKDERAKYGNVEDADWEDVDDEMMF